MTDQKLIQKLEKTVSRLRVERQFKRDIINALHEGIVVFDPNQKIQVINEQAQKLLAFNETSQSFFKDLEFFKNKKRSIRFNLKKWFSTLCCTPNKLVKEEAVWIYSSHTQEASHPLLLSAKPLFDNNQVPQGLLLIIYDRAIEDYADQQHRLLEAAFNSYDGQFITDEKGYITHPNFAFSAYTSIMTAELKKMTIIEWLNRQVTLKNNIQVKDIIKTLLNEKKWSGEIELRPFGDTVFYSVLSISMLTDKDNNVEHYVGTLQDITDIKEVQAEVEHLAYYDDLTDLPNRRLIIEHLEKAIQHHQRNQTYTALLYIDLDNFKEINDIYGHQMGDNALIATAQLIQDNLRAEDIVARINADEFIILTHYSTPTKETAIQKILTLSDKLQHALEKDIDLDNTLIPSSASIGVCIFPLNETDTAKDIISYADLAMTEAKKKGKNQTYFYKTALTEKILQRRKIEEAFKKASFDKEFFLAYQPQINTKKDDLSAEILIRWINPELGFVPPDQFIHITEENKQILKLGHWIIKTAFKQAKTWFDTYDKKIHLSINISPVQFRESNFVEELTQLQQETNILPEWITLELTEGILIEDIETALAKIKTLTKLGYEISIDDFGTGYSSLSYFQKLPIHELKIDQSFVNKLPGSAEDTAIVDTIIQLANSKKLIIVAEGVETVEQLKFFKKQKTEILIQGYFYDKPLKSHEFEEKYLKNSYSKDMDTTQST